MLLLELGVTCYLTYAFSTVTLNPFLPPMAVIAIGLTPQHMPSGTDDVCTRLFTPSFLFKPHNSPSHFHLKSQYGSYSQQ
jgi:hypothetical protein